MATGCKSRAPKGPTTTHSPPVARRGLPILQIPAYPDKAPLARGEDTLYRFPLLVFASERRNARGYSELMTTFARRPIRRVKIFEKIDTSQCSTTCRTALLHLRLMAVSLQSALAQNGH